MSAELDFRNPYLPTFVEETWLRGREHDVARALRGQLAKGVDITPAEIVYVAKPATSALRPISIVGLLERITARHLLRAVQDELPLSERTAEVRAALDADVIAEDGEYVVIADVASFYDLIDHGLMAHEVIFETGNADAAGSLQALHGFLMGRRFGLPQVYSWSDTLSDLIVAIPERRLLRAGYSVYRYNDDFRISAASRVEAEQALRQLHEEIRAVGLVLNDQKTYILSQDRYVFDSSAPEEMWLALADAVDADLRAFTYGEEEVVEEPGAPNFRDAAVETIAAVTSTAHRVEFPLPEGTSPMLADHLGEAVENSGRPTHECAS